MLSSPIFDCLRVREEDITTVLPLYKYNNVYVVKQNMMIIVRTIILSYRVKFNITFESHIKYFSFTRIFN